MPYLLRVRSSKSKVNFCPGIFGRKAFRERYCEKLLSLSSPRMLLGGGATVL